MSVGASQVQPDNLIMLASNYRLSNVCVDKNPAGVEQSLEWNTKRHVLAPRAHRRGSHHLC
jgi:hypothetical protein